MLQTTVGTRIFLLERVVTFEWCAFVASAIMQQALSERRAFLVSNGELNLPLPSVVDAPHLVAPFVGRGTPRMWSSSEPL